MKVTNEMIDRFLAWKLPENFNPDNGIIFEPLMNKGTAQEMKRDPIGTNLLDWQQAKEMLEYVLADNT